MANIVVTVATNVGKYLAGPAIREVQYFLCVNKVINDLENEKEALISERNNLQTRVAQARERTEIIENPVEKWLNDVENLLREVDVLVQRTETDNNCFQGWFPTCGRYLLCKQMVQKIEAMEKFKGKSNDIQPFSHLAPLPGIQYHSSEDFVYFGSRQKAYDELFETLKDDTIHMIGLYGSGGSGKTTLITEVGKKVDKMEMFDKVIPITVSQTPNIRGMQGKVADMLNLKLDQETEEGRAQRLWMSLEKKDRILVIVDGLWTKFDLKDIGICLNSSNKSAWKIIVTSRDQDVCTLMNCQKKIHLEILSEDESWTWFQKLANIDEDISNSMDTVPREVCNECKGLPIAIKTVASSLKGKLKPELELTLANLRDSKAFDDHEGTVKNAMNCLKLSYDYLPRPETQQLFLLCPLYPEGYHIPTEDLTRIALGLGVGEMLLLQSRRSLIQTDINKLLASGLLMRGSVKMHDMVRDTALWIANRSDNNKILVNVDKPLSIVAEDNNIRDCFAVSSWWYNENPSFCQLHAPNLKMLLVNISSQGSLNSLDLSRLTFEGIQGLEVFSLTINYKIVPLSFPPSIQLLTNVRTLRLNGLKFDDISFIASLTRLEILELRRCEFNELPIEIGKLVSLKLLDLSECHIEKTYNGAIGKCSQLEELYASTCYPKAYVREIIVDIVTLPNLQRFVLSHLITPKGKQVIQVDNFNISKLRASNKNILQIAETICLIGLHGGSKNIIPDMVGVVGGMNNLSTLNLTDCKEIECIFDATCDFHEEDMIPKLVELSLNSLYNLTELCHGPPMQVLRYFEKLELLDIQKCMQLHNIFPWECKLQNLKLLRLSYCKTDEVLFSASVAQSLQQLEQLTIRGCSELKHLIAASRSKHGGCSSSEEIIPAPMNSHFFMTKLRDIDIFNCISLESIFPICYIEGLAQLQKMYISRNPKLEYVFGECDHQCQSHVMLPHLEALNLLYLDNLIGMCPENCQAKWPSQSLRTINIQGCPKLAIPWFNLKVGYGLRQHHLNQNLPTKLKKLTLSDVPQLYSMSLVGPTPRKIWSLQCLQRLTVGNCEALKYLFSMETHRSQPKLVYLRVYDCQELEQIVVADEELVQSRPNAELYFPKLKEVDVYKCNKLKSLFPLSMVTMLPQLSTLHLSKANQLQEVFRHNQEHGVLNELEIVLPNLTEITLLNLRNFVDICHGCKLHAVKLQKLSISNCPKTASSLGSIEIMSKYMKHPASEYYDTLNSIEKMYFDFGDEIEEEVYVEEPSQPISARDKGKTKKIKKRIESAISDQKKH